MLQSIIYFTFCRFFCDSLNGQIFTARSIYVRAVFEVEILSVRPSATRVLCDKTKQCTANIVIQHETAINVLYCVCVLMYYLSIQLHSYKNVNKRTDLLTYILTYLLTYYQCSFLSPTVVGGRRPFRLKFALKLTHPIRKTPISTNFRL